VSKTLKNTSKTSKNTIKHLKIPQKCPKNRYIGYQSSHAVAIFIIVTFLLIGLITVIVLLIVLPGFGAEFANLLYDFIVNWLFSVLFVAWLQKFLLTAVFSTHGGTVLRHRNV
jgi:hypothetical protein